MRSTGRSAGQAATVTHKAAFLWNKFPKFCARISRDVVARELFTLFSKDQVTSLANLSRWAFLLTFAGVGLRHELPADVEARLASDLLVGALGEVADRRADVWTWYWARIEILEACEESKKSKALPTQCPAGTGDATAALLIQSPN